MFLHPPSIPAACQGTGHIARNCPNAAADGAAAGVDGAEGAAAKTCYTCGKAGASSV